MNSRRAIVLLSVVIGVAACDDAVGAARRWLLHTLQESSLSSRRAAIAAAEELPPIERQRETLSQYSACARTLRQDIEDSWRTFQATSDSNEPAQETELALGVAGLEQCIRTQFEGTQTTPRSAQLEESLRTTVEAAEAYDSALRRYASLSRQSGAVASLAPERKALAAALESAYIGWSVAVSNLEKHIAERRHQVDRLDLEHIAERAGKRAEYYVRAIQFTVASAKECVSQQHTVHGCLDRMTGVATAIADFQTFLESHEAAAQTVFWLPLYRREVDHLGRATARLLERARAGKDATDALDGWLERSDFLERQAQNLRFDQPHPVHSTDDPGTEHP